jgi:hypothetical protein
LVVGGVEQRARALQSDALEGQAAPAIKVTITASSMNTDFVVIPGR